MGASVESVTSLTLLRQLRERPNDPRGWDEFVARYGPKIHGWCLRWGLQEADANDVTQNVLLALSKQMKSFRYDPSGKFRSWLKTIARRAWCDFVTSRRRRMLPIEGLEEADRLLSEAAQQDFLQGLEEECDREMLDAAIALVRPRVHAHTWRSWEMAALEGRAAAEIAQELGVKEGSVYMARSRVQRMLLEEVERLDAD